jgi:hypothetical protein
MGEYIDINMRISGWYYYDPDGKIESGNVSKRVHSWVFFFISNRIILRNGKFTVTCI